MGGHLVALAAFLVRPHPPSLAALVVVLDPQVNHRRDAREGVPPTTRHFVDRVPVLIGGFDVTLVYVQRWAPLGAFAGFLNTYTPLLRRLPHAVIRFCTPDERVVERAARMCHRRFGSGPSEVTTTADAKGDLDRLREELQRFSADRWNVWYQRWCVDGDQAVAPNVPSPSDPPRTSPIEFVEERLPHSYPLFRAIDDVPRLPIERGAERLATPPGRCRAPSGVPSGVPFVRRLRIGARKLRPVRHFVSRTAREGPHSSRAGEGGSDPPVERPRPLAPALGRHPPGVAPSLALSEWSSAKFRAAALSIDLSIDLSISLSISLSIDLSIRHHIADSIHLLLHLERGQGRRLVNEVVRVRGYDSEHGRYLTETRYQRHARRSSAA